MAYNDAFTVPDGRAYVFENKKTKDTHPDFRGQMVLTQDYRAGDVIKLAIWNKTTKTSGKPWLLVSEETDAWKAKNRISPKDRMREVRDDDSDVPFQSRKPFFLTAGNTFETHTALTLPTQH